MAVIRSLTPKCRVTIGGTYNESSDGSPLPGSQSFRPLDYDSAGSVIVQAVSAEVTIPMSAGSLQAATARVTLAEAVAIFEPEPDDRFPLIIEMGLTDSDGTVYYERVFTGWTSTLNRRHFPYMQELSGVGILSLAHLPLKEHTTVSRLEEWRVVRKMLDKAGVRGWDIDGNEDYRIGVSKPVFVSENSPPGDLIEQLDRLLMYITHDTRSGVVKRRRFPGVSGDLGTDPEYFFKYAWDSLSLPMWDVQHSFDGTRRRNRVKVLGLLGDNPDSTRKEHTRQSAPVDFVPDPPRYLTERIDSDLIEYDDYAELICKGWMRRLNRLQDNISFTTSGNPYIETGKLAHVTHSPLGISGYYVLTSVGHRFGRGGWTTSIEAELSADGYAGLRQDTTPVADFTFTTELLSDPTETNFYYEVTCDGSNSYDVDSTDANLRLSWSNSAGGQELKDDSVDAQEYAFSVERAIFESDTPVTVTLRATDPDRLWSTFTDRVNS